MEPVPCQLYRRIFVSCSRSHLKPPRTNKCADSRGKTPYKSTGTLRLQGLFAYAGRGLSFPPTRQNVARVIIAITCACTIARPGWTTSRRGQDSRGGVNQNDSGQGYTEKVRPRCGQPSDRGRLKNRTERNMYDRLLEPRKEMKTIIFYTCFRVILYDTNFLRCL